MPSYSYNSIALKGKTERVHNFIKEGLKNCGLDSCGDIMKDYWELLDKGFTYAGKPKDEFKGKGFEEFKHEQDIVTVPAVHLTTFRPVPETFLKYDTCNHPECFPEAVKEQREKYGQVGWYDFNRCFLIGCKWDAPVEHPVLSVSDDGDTATFSFYCETAWTFPGLWLSWVRETFSVDVLMMTQEEGFSYCFFGANGTEEESLDWSDIENAAESVSGGEPDEDTLESCEEQMLSDMRERYEAFVKDYEPSDE